MQSGVLAHTSASRQLQASSAKLQSCPLCAACQYGKQRRTSAPGRTTQAVRERDGALKQDNLFPGQKVSVDHFICSTRGRLKHTFGKEDLKDRSISVVVAEVVRSPLTLSPANCATVFASAINIAADAEAAEIRFRKLLLMAQKSYWIPFRYRRCGCNDSTVSNGFDQLIYSRFARQAIR